LAFKRHELRVERAEDRCCRRKRRAPVDHVAAGQDAFGQAGVVLPEFLAGLHVDRPQAAVGAGDIHHAVLDQRLRFLAALLFAAEGERPLRHEVLDVLLVDRGERAEALALRAEAVGHDVVGRRGVVDDLVDGDAFCVCR
jgi:hypothetical protein